MRAWLIAADDRTGALETAGMCGGGIVTTKLTRPIGCIVVIDLGTRHLGPGDAAARVARVDGVAAGRHGHKTDSLLRGQWAAELMARQRRIVFVPAFPAMGRTCTGGVVRAHGVPVDELADGRGGAITSRPAAALSADEVTTATLAAWLRGSGCIAVCDAATDEDLAVVAAILDQHPDVAVAGPAAVQAAAAGGRPPSPRLPLPIPALVVCGSLHPVALDQCAAASRVPGVTALSPETRPTAESGDSDAVAATLAAEAHRHLDGMRTLVIVGGDTAAAVLGPADVRVDGTVGPGMPWCRRVLDRQLHLVTKAGSFGDPSSIARLFQP